jgi:hypothetical protein
MMPTAMTTAALMIVPGPFSPIAPTSLATLLGFGLTEVAAVLVGVGVAVLARIAVSRASSSGATAEVVRAAA